MGASASRNLQKRLWSWIRVPELGLIHKSEILEWITNDESRFFINTENLEQTRKLMVDMDQFASDLLSEKHIGFLFAGWTPEKLELVYQKLIDGNHKREDFQNMKQERTRAQKKNKLLKAVFVAFDPYVTGFVGSNVVNLLANQDGVDQVRSTTLRKRIASTTHGADVSFSQFVHCFSTWTYGEVAKLHQSLDLNATASLALTQQPPSNTLSRTGNASRASTASKNFNKTKVFRDQHEFAMAFEEVLEFKKHAHTLKTHEHTLALKRKTEARAERGQLKVAEEKLNQRKERSRALLQLRTQEKEAAERKAKEEARLRQERANKLQNRELQLRQRDEERKSRCKDSMRETYTNALRVVMSTDVAPTAQEIRLLDSLQQRHNISRRDENQILNRVVGLRS